VFSSALYINDDGVIQYERILSFAVFTPIREEMMFRAVIFFVLEKRYPFIIAADSKPRRIHNKWKSILISNSLFALLHLVNIFDSGSSVLYVLLQVKSNILE
jgi:membrane protease YdiL (CAAX protease family)